ncbi:MAG: hypothetical protein D9C04_04775 [Nitrosopumilus sp. B06]|nr:MAG: hypothetical protein D9C04_04775 [Nitrosopumilus sp. B06]
MENMDNNSPSQSNQTAATTTSRRIKNTFAPACNNEYFTPGTLFSLCKYGFPFEKLPEEGKKMVREYAKEYDKKCTRTGDKMTFPPPPSGPNVIV